MYIKTVTIEGFKSYKNRTVVGPFHQGFNVVIGRNGSGKSNFFSAIEFCLSEEYCNLKPDQRTSLLSGSSSGARPINAYVEILFDNQERRFPDNKDEVVIRRTIGAKKDQFHLNGKASNRKELSGLLEAAGFSNSNPFYIVKQGQISSLATCTDKKRLEIVQNLAGITVYNEKRKASEDELSKTDNILAQVQTNLEQITERLNQLEVEKEDLLKFKKLDAKRRTLEYIILEKDLNEAIGKTNATDLEYQHLVEEFQEANKKIKNATIDFESKKEELVVKKRSYNVLSKEVQELKILQESQLKKKANLELKLSDFEQEDLGQSLPQGDLEDLQEQLEELNDQKGENEKLLKTKLSEAENVRQDLDMLEHERQEMVSKSGRNEIFNSREERDVWIDGELGKLSVITEQRKLENVSIQEDLNGFRNDLGEKESSLNQFQTDLIELEDTVKETQEKLKSLRETKSSGLSGTAKMAQEFQKLKTEREVVYEQFRAAEGRLKASRTLRDIFIGAESIDSLMDSDERYRAGFYGMVIGLFTCSKDLFTVCDQIAGLKLFSFVVDSRQTATKLIRELNRRKYPGVFNFIPKDTIWPKNLNFNESRQDAIPLLDKLEFESDNEKVMKFIFGNTLVCRTLETVTELARKHGVDCITLDGDKGSSKGVLSGGYFDPSRNKMLLHQNVQRSCEILENLDQKLADLDGKITIAQANLRKVNTEIANNETRLMKTERNLSKAKEDMTREQVERDQLFSKCINSEKVLSSIQIDIKRLEASYNNLVNEKEEELNSQLADNEKDRFEVVVKKIQETKSKFKSSTKSFEELDTERSSISNKIGVLIKRIDDAKDNIAKSNSRRLDKHKIEVELSLTSSQIKESAEGLVALDQKEVLENSEMRNLEKLVNEKEQEVSNLAEIVQSGSRQQEQVLKKKLQLSGIIGKLRNSMKEIEGIHNAIVDQHKNDSRSSLSKLLRKVRNDLKKYENVNKKALEQLQGIADKEDLEERLASLRSSRNKITDLIATLDEKRAEQIDYTFKQMKKNFSSIFEKIVPEGQGELVLNIPEGQSDDDDSQSEQSESLRSLNATELQILVSFTGKLIDKSFELRTICPCTSKIANY